MSRHIEQTRRVSTINSSSSSAHSSQPLEQRSPFFHGLRTNDTSGVGREVQLAEAEGAVPEDDGMSVLRRHIIEIQNRTVSGEEKARLMHELMTAEYHSSLLGLQQSKLARGQSPVSSLSQDRPVTPSSGYSYEPRSAAVSPQTSRSSICDDISVMPSDRKPSFWDPQVPDSSPTSGPATPTGSRDPSLEEAERRVLGCKHYKRNVKLQCVQCHHWHACRFCHDDAEDHMIVRQETRNMLCMLCGCAQPAAGECKNCGESAACYYCDVCKFWDNEPTRSIYHCDDCGICRVGEGLGKDFYHCKTCLACLAISIRDTHRCIERSTDCNCPICGEYMFTSPQTVVFMRCGHSIHHACYKEHMQSSFKCPICSRSIINMEMSFRNLDRAIAAQPMPPQFRDTKALVCCNDCSTRSSVQYHWLGLKCAVCDSYNTAQLQILSEAPPSSTVQGLQSRGAGSETSTSSFGPSENSHQPLRGRNWNMLGPNRRTATSTSALQPPRPLSTHAVTARIGRSVSEHTQSAPRALIEFDNQSEASASNSDDGLAFWGGENPSERATQATRVDTPASDGSGSDYSNDEVEDIDMDADTDEDSAEEDSMDIMGHR